MAAAPASSSRWRLAGSSLRGAAAPTTRGLRRGRPSQVVERSGWAIGCQAWEGAEEPQLWRVWARLAAAGEASVSGAGALPLRFMAGTRDKRGQDRGAVILGRGWMEVRRSGWHEALAWARAAGIRQRRPWRRPGAECQETRVANLQQNTPSSASFFSSWDG